MAKIIKSKVNYLQILMVSVLLLIHLLLGLDTIRHLSPTYDEPLHLAAGYSYWKTGVYRLNIYDHPPLAEMIGAIPAVFMNPVLLTTHPYWENYEQYSFANMFLYNNKPDAEKMLNSGRAVILLFSCLLGFIVFLWAKDLYGSYTGILVLFLYVFSSNFLAHGTLVTTDLISILFFFLGIYLFWRWFENRTYKNSIYCGIATGLALCSKFSAPVIFLIYFIICILECKARKISFYTLLKHSAAMLGSVLFVMLFVYRFSNLGLYFDGMHQMFKSMDRGRSSFLFGMHSTTGWKYYFLANFLIKTPVPFIILLAVSFIFIKKYKREELSFLLIPAGIYFLTASFSKVQIGLRHILPIYPLLFVWSGNIIKNISGTANKFVKYGVLAALLVWYAVSCLKVHPWHLSYFNEFAGGPKNGYKCLTDSNVDWGQGLKELGKWAKENKVESLYLCYFGVGDPHYYGIKYTPIGFVDNLTHGERSGDDITADKRIILAVSATNLQATYYADKNLFSWLKTLQPLEIAAESILVYDLTGKPESLKKLAEILELTGNIKQAEYLRKESK